MSLSGPGMQTSKQIKCQIFGVKEIGPFAFLGLFGIEKITTFWVILTNGWGQTQLWAQAILSFSKYIPNYLHTNILSSSRWNPDDMP